ncbi:MAG: Mini-ribonuclease 3 [Bacteroidota bacterium]
MKETESLSRAAELPPATLAYVGDAVFELYVRERLVRDEVHVTARSLHRRATALVRASSQAAIARALSDRLTPAEQDILRRGRNAHCGHVPAGAKVADYRLATGLESLVGFLYLSGQTERLRALLGEALEAPAGEGHA